MGGAVQAWPFENDTANSALPQARAALHRFAKPWYKLRALHIFRDQTNLAGNPALWSSIREALDQSLFYILLASPEAAVSPWVALEAEYWIPKGAASPPGSRRRGALVQRLCPFRKAKPLPVAGDDGPTILNPGRNV
jgi:hypothetical protein